MARWGSKHRTGSLSGIGTRTVVPLRGVGVAGLFGLLTFACSEEAPDPWSRVEAFGDPRFGLSAEERARFEEGRILFDRIFTAEDGLGPLFNEDQCSACHTDPAAGGTGEQVVRKAARFDSATGACDLLAHAGGENLRSRVTSTAEELGVVRDTVPAGATDVAVFDVPFLFGLGAADAVHDSTLERLADPEDRNGDGISGRLGRTPDGRIGRFGRKADVATLRDFTVSALLNEMGLTTADRPAERGTNGAPLPTGADPGPDPEVSPEDVDLLTDFVRFLGTPPSSAPSDPLLWEQGREQFRLVGCGACHLSELPMDAGAGVASLFSDFLLHDLGPALGGAPCGPAASPDEYRTAPLVGLSANRTYLHDGRARTLEEAVSFHGGEASGVRAAFEALDPVRRAALLAYLETL